MRYYRYLARCVLAAVAVIALAYANGSAHAQDIKYKLKLPTVVSFELNLPSLIAYANGYFKDEGIEITDFVLGSGGIQRTAVIAKEYDFGLFGFIHVPIARNAGSPWKAVLSLHDREIFGLVVRNELKSKVRKVSDLRGLKVGFSSPGAAAWYVGSL